MRRRFFLASTSLAALTCATVVSAQSTASTETYTYDALGRLVRVVTTGGTNNAETQSICYDPAGNRTEYRSNTSSGTALCSGSPAPTPTPTPTPTPATSISVADGSAVEGGSVSFVVSLNAARTTSMSVNYATAAGTAGSSDFQARSGTLTVAAGETSKTVTVPTTQDLLVEATESFTINLSGATGGATIADGQGVGLIYDDDEIPDPGCGQFECF